ncbi:MAG TPA: hypothetical protein PKY78_05575, partial [Candidatus Omnitrophota bacterium]|nr:hypothetical protein [Candidatus Omnitrophota bacterium]
MSKKVPYGINDAAGVKNWYDDNATVDPVSLIELQSNRHKRLILKATSILVSFVFLLQQEVSYADLYQHKRLGGAAEEVLPSSQDYEQSNKFAPAYLRRQQMKHEEIIRQRMGKEELVEDLLNKHHKGRGKKDGDDTPLKKKKSSGGGSGSSGDNAEYTLTDPDDDTDDAHQLNDIETSDSTSTTTTSPVQTITSYDVTRRPYINLEYWEDETDKFVDEDTGLDYWVGYEDKDLPSDSRKISETIYFGDSDNKKISKVYSGYVLNPTTGQYAAKFRTDYEYSGDDVSATRKYFIAKDGTETLVEYTLFEGTGDNNRVSQSLTYDVESHQLISRRDYEYTGDALSTVSDYDTEGLDYDSNGDGSIDDTNGDGKITDGTAEGTGKLESRTYLKGAQDREVADYTLTYSDSGEVSSTTIDYYEGGERASAAFWRDAKETVVSYRGAIDTEGEDSDGDGIIDAYIDKVTSAAHYDTYARNPGEEVLDYTETYARGYITRTTFYYYGEEETNAHDANYRTPLTKSVTYWGDATDDEGNLKADAKICSVTYYSTEWRLKGEEMQDYSVKFYLDGTTIRETTVYIYEGGNRADDADVYACLERATTYWGEGVDSKGEMLADAKKKSETVYQYRNTTQRGEEVADITLNYYRDGETVRDTTVYFYTGNLRASESTYRTGLERSATFWGDATDAISLLSSDGTIDMEGVAAYIKSKLGVDIGSYLTASELKTALMNAVLPGQSDLVSYILSQDSAEVFDAEKVVESLFSLFGGDQDLLKILLSIDFSAITTKEELIKAVLVAAGMTSEKADLTVALLMKDVDDYSSSSDFLKAFIQDALATGASQSVISDLIMSALYLDEDVTSSLFDALGELVTDAELKAFLSELSGKDMTALGIESITGLIEYLKEHAAAEGYTEEDVTELFLAYAVSRTVAIRGTIADMEELAIDIELKAFLDKLKSADLGGLGIKTLSDLITYLMENATTANGYTVDDVLLLVMSYEISSQNEVGTILKEMLKSVGDPELKDFISNLTNSDLKSLGITDIKTLIQYLMENATATNGYTTDDVTLLLAAYRLSIKGMDATTLLDAMLEIAVDPELKSFLATLKSKGLSTLGIDTLAELIAYLKENATEANGFTVEDVILSLLAAGANSEMDVATYLDEMESLASDPELKAFLSELKDKDLASLGINSISDLIAYLKE